MMVKNLTKALQILRFISEFPQIPTMGQIATRLKMNRATVYRILQTLCAEGYLTKDENTSGYILGLNLLPLAAKLLDNIKIRIESFPHLQELALKCGERVNLGILFKGEILYLSGVEKPSLPGVFSRFGKRAPAHCCSLGKIILAHMEEEEVNRVLRKNPLTLVTENSITDPDLFRKHLAEIRSQGYAIDQGEHVPGSYCISALIRDSKGRGIGAISISSGNLEKIKGFLPDLLEKAEIISHLMGYRR